MERDVFWSRSFCLLTTDGAPIEVIRKYIENQGQKWGDWIWPSKTKHSNFVCIQTKNRKSDWRKRVLPRAWQKGTTTSRNGRPMAVCRFVLKKTDDAVIAVWLRRTVAAHYEQEIEQVKTAVTANTKRFYRTPDTPNRLLDDPAKSISNQKAEGATFSPTRLYMLRNAFSLSRLQRLLFIIDDGAGRSSSFHLL